MADKTYTEITLKAIEDAMKDIEIKDGPLPYMKKIGPGLWEISSGGRNPMIMWTGDGGAAEMIKAMKTAGEEYDIWNQEYGKNLEL